MKHNSYIQQDLNEALSPLRVNEYRRTQMMKAITEQQKPVKRKWKTAFVLSMALVVASAVALAAGLTLRYSARATATQTARQALMDTYGLSVDMVRVFGETTHEQDGKTIVTYTAEGTNFVNPEAMGTYTVTVDAQGSATAAWSHDGTDPAVWVNGDLTAPVWGAPQLQQSLDRYALYEAWWRENENVYSLPHEQQVERFRELAQMVAPLTLTLRPMSEAEIAAEAERVQATEEAPAVALTAPENTPVPTPPPGQLTAEEAIALARTAMAQTYQLSEAQLDAHDIEVMYGWPNENTLTVNFFGTQGIGDVVLDATSGEVQEVRLDLGIGGNG